MAYFDQRPNLFRLIFGMLAVVLLCMATFNFYRFGSAPTDENWFREPISNYYVTKNFPGVLAEQKSILRKPDTTFSDSIKIGDLIRSINGQKLDIKQLMDQLLRKGDVKDALEQLSRLDYLQQINHLLMTSPPDSPLTMTVFRLIDNKNLMFRINRSTVPDSFVRYLPSAAHVFEVFKGGASDRAGMKVGDLILRINGRSFSNIHEADRIMRSARAGKTIDYEVLRENRVLILHVTLARFGFPIFMLLRFLIGLIFICAAIFIAEHRCRLKSARLLGWALLLMGFCIAAGMNHHHLRYDAFAMLRFVFILISFSFGVATWLESAYYFPKERSEILRHRWLRIVPYAVALVFSAYFGLGFLIRNVVVGEQLFPLLIYTTLIYNLLVHLLFRKQRPAEYKRLNRTVAWTIYLVLIAITLTDPIARLIGVKQIGNYNSIPLLLIPFAYLYTIGRYRLLNISWHIRRNIQYTILSVIWGLLLIFVLLSILLELPDFNFRIPNFRLTLTSFEIVNEPLAPGRRDLLEKTFLMFLAVGLSFLFWKIGKWGQNLIDKKYYHTQFDYRRAASDLAEVMATRLNMVDLAHGIIQKLTELLQLKQASVLFFRDQEICCHQNACMATERQELLLPVDQQFIIALEKYRTDARFSVDLLPQSIKERLYEQGFRHVIPIWFKEKLEGALLIGEKLSESPFNADDLRFLTAVAKQASVAIENSFLYEVLAEQERMKHELQLARRIQMSSLPQNTPAIKGLDIAGTSIPATEVGGDYFDYLDGALDTVTVIVGDVSGKGTSAALYLFKIQGILRSLYELGLSPRELFIRTNKILYRDLDRQSFVTAIGGFFDTKQRRLIFARAGHLPLFYYQTRSKSVQILAPKGLGLGLDNETIFSKEIEETVLNYDSGDIFLFISDGITEAQNKFGQEFGEARVAKILHSNSSRQAEGIRDQIIVAVKEFTANMNQHDDQTIVVVKAV